MEKTDSLSRRPDLKVEVENNNENQKLIKKEWVWEMLEAVVKKPEIILVEKIENTREKDTKSGKSGKSGWRNEKKQGLRY